MTDEVFISPLLLSDKRLWQSQVALNLLCGRNKFPLKQKHRELLCAASTLLAIESVRRGKPIPATPAHAGQLDDVPPGAA